MDTIVASAITKRFGRRADIPFLARIEEEASTPPFEQSLWTELLEPSGTPVRDFLAAMFAADASQWGRVEDFVLLEVAERPAAACALFRPCQKPGSEGPLDLSRLPEIASLLSWDEKTLKTFRRSYEKAWSGNLDFLCPQAEMIVETVAVLPEFRGRGLGHALMRAAFETARAKGARSLGIMVIHGNDTAKRLYETYFQPYITFHQTYFEDRFPGLTKFRADLRH